MLFKWLTSRFVPRSPAPADDAAPELPVDRAEESASATKLQLLDSLSNIPTGQYAALADHDVPERFADSFAILKSGDAAAYLLVAVEALGSHEQFEIVQRLHDSGLTAVAVRPATQEIVRCVHEANVPSGTTTNTDVENAAWTLIDDAVSRSASDIHIETRGSFAQVFLRIFGERIPMPPLAATSAAEICEVLYTVHADGNNKGITWDPTTVQGTVIEHTTRTGKRVQLRFASAPIHPSGNFQAVIRCLVMDEETIRPLEQVGYTPEQVKAIEEMLVGSQGMVLTVGPTNSGKSTSMQSMIDRIYAVRGPLIKVVTVEDPVEYILRLACQMGVPEGRKGLEDANSGSIYTTFLKGILRQDPDVAMVGEIRDSESAEHVKQLVLAGRKLLTTLHVYEVDAVFARLRELGLPESVLFMKGFVSGVVCQRLVPLLCPQCAIGLEEAVASGRIRQATFDRVRGALPADHEHVRSRGKGCPHCNGMGIVGRTPCAELLIPDAKFLRLMASGEVAAAQEHWRGTSGHLSVDGRGTSMIAHALQKLGAGLVCPADVETHIGHIVLPGSEEEMA